MEAVFLLVVLLPVAFGSVDLNSSRKKEVCFPEIGCFNYDYPFLDPPRRPLSWAPQSPQIVDPKFNLYTRKNPDKKDGQLLVPTDPVTIQNSYFDPTKETKLICHGFIESGLIEWDMWMTDMVREFLNHDDFNVIRITWGKGSLFPYTQAMANTRVVGAMTSLLIDKIKEVYGIGAETFHFIGHSLGSHIGGYVGERQANLGRITGLDPAGPGFEEVQPEVRLDPTDALFVDAIHTDAQHTLDFGFGMIKPVGHMDFYPNSGQHQPGCDQSLIEDFLDEGVIGGVVQFVACNHLRAHELFSDSINKCPIYAFKCPMAGATYEDNFLNGECFNRNDLAMMGYQAIDYKPLPGVQQQVYYTITTASSPFCANSPFRIHVYFKDPWFSETFLGWGYVTLIGSSGITQRTPLNPESLDFVPGTDMNFIINTDIDPGDLSGLTFYWEYDFELLNPWDWPIFEDLEVFIAKIEVDGLVLQKSYVMCNSKPKKGINSKKEAHFYKSNC
ncbi:pancreatic triacylglycerol lipase-like [Asterias rubens]|uniref:pancreatic triacylglycerol lipase-like n=1 Tax=Asterias rubens TaxID=7604 RepID=UPI0014552C72|nr:pancreatic triacylglycerol lipase-like [Asterias rubens]